MYYYTVCTFYNIIFNCTVISYLYILFRFFATGDAFSTIGFNYRVGNSTTGKIVDEVSQAIWDALQPQYMPEPVTDDWKAIAEDFKSRWNFPNCIGALDGKHVVLQAPPSSGSKYFNYKGSHSIVLLALVDANYMFRVIDVGGYGRNSDGGIFSESPLGKRLRAGTLGIPEDTTIQGAEDLGPMPHVFVADEAFPLQRHIMRPYPGRQLQRKERCFNYRLSRARRIVENAFGILSTQWRMYRRALGICPKKADSVVKATCVLHNYLRKNGEMERGIPQLTSADNTRDAGLEAITQAGSNNSSREAASIRNKYCDYFNSTAGEVPWQHQML